MTSTISKICCFYLIIETQLTIVFQTQLEMANDQEYSAKFFTMLTKSMTSFSESFDKYSSYCNESALEVPCELFRYNEDATIHEVVGTLRAVVENVIEDCVDGFGWQWTSAVEGLMAAVGGVIPDIVIPDVSGTVRLLVIRLPMFSIGPQFHHFIL